MEIIAYHGGDAPIRRFARSRSAQGVFWFSEDKDRILAGESWASSVKYLMEAEPFEESRMHEETVCPADAVRDVMEMLAGKLVPTSGDWVEGQGWKAAWR
jgi:hypothetical protein